MSVIPLVFAGPNPTVVDRPDDFQKAGGLDGNAIFIRPLNRDQLESPNNANITYDLRVGQEYRDHRELDKSTLDETTAISLLPGMAVLIETEEEFHVPKTTFGVIVPKVDLLQRGVSNTGSKVDPGYRGPLVVTVFNLGKKACTLKRGDAFCSVFFMTTADGVRPYAKSPKRIVGQVATSRLRRFRDWLEASHTLWLIVLTIATLISVVVSILR